MLINAGSLNRHIGPYGTLLRAYQDQEFYLGYPEGKNKYRRDDITFCELSGKAAASSNGVSVIDPIYVQS